MNENAVNSVNDKVPLKRRMLPLAKTNLSPENFSIKSEFIENKENSLTVKNFTGIRRKFLGLKIACSIQK